MFLFFTANLLELSQLDEKVGVVYFKGNDNLKKCFEKKPTSRGFNKLVTGGLPPPVGPLTTVCLDFINENKNYI